MDTKKLRQKILDLAIHGKLVPQDPNDEPASVLLERIRAEKEQLIKEGKIKAPKKSKSAGDRSHYPKDGPFEVPEGWVWTRLCDITELIEDCPHSTAKDEGAGFALIRTPNVGEGHLILDGVHRVSESVYNKRNTRAIPTEGDIIYAREAPAGNAAVIRKGELVCLGQRTVLIRPVKQFVDTKLLTYFILSTNSRNRLISTAVGSTAAHVNLETIRPFLIPLPPINEQKGIVVEIEKWLFIISSLQDSIASVNNTIQSTKKKILNLAIHGKLVPQDPSDEPAIELLKRINPDFKPSDNLHYEGILPSGWTLCCLEDVLDYEQPQAYIVNSTDYSDDYKTPVLTPGKSFVLGYTNELSGICNHLPVIIFDDFTTESKYVDFPFKVKSSAMKILRARGEINLKYVAIFMSITRLVGDTHKRYWISEYSKIPIPIPPLREQGRIVLAAKHLLNQLDNLIACISDN